MSNTGRDDTSLDLLNSPYLTGAPAQKTDRVSLIPAAAGAHLSRPLGSQLDSVTPLTERTIPAPSAAQEPTLETSPAPEAARNSPDTEMSAFWSIVKTLRDRASDRYADELAGREGISEDERQSMGWKHIDSVIDEMDRENMQTGGQAAAWSSQERQALRQALRDDMFGLGRFQALLDEPEVENVHINGCDRVWVELAGGRMEPRPPVADSDEQLMADLQYLASHAGEESRSFSAASPDLDMDLRGAVRLAATAPPISKRPTAVFRVHRFVNVTLDQMVETGVISPLACDFLTACVKAQKTIVISGFGGDGKTTLMRSLAGRIPPMEQIVTIEKERELHLDRLDSLMVPPIELQYRPGVGERTADGSRIGEYTLAQAMEKALRLNSRRILVGEVRGTEITAMIQAMQTGAGTFCTVHSYSAQEAVHRLVGLGMNEFSEALMTRQLGHHLDIVLQMRKIQDAQGLWRRKVVTIAEVMPGDSADGISVAPLFEMRPGDDHAQPVQPPGDTRLRADLERVGFDLTRVAGGA